MESITYFKNVKIPPKKLRYLLADIKKNGPVEARDHLLYGPSRASRILYKALQSAIAAAKLTLNTQDNLLKFKTLTVEEGTHMRRFRAGARGAVKPVVKRTSHIKIVLTVPESISTAKSRPAQEVKEVKTVGTPAEKKIEEVKKTKKTEKVTKKAKTVSK